MISKSGPWVAMVIAEPPGVWCVVRSSAVPVPSIQQWYQIKCLNNRSFPNTSSLFYIMEKTSKTTIPAVTKNIPPMDVKFSDVSNIYI